MWRACSTLSKPPIRSLCSAVYTLPKNDYCIETVFFSPEEEEADRRSRHQVQCAVPHLVDREIAKQASNGAKKNREPFRTLWFFNQQQPRTLTVISWCRGDEQPEKSKHLVLVNLAVGDFIMGHSLLFSCLLFVLFFRWLAVCCSK
jgi:hypothetical protein